MDNLNFFSQLNPKQTLVKVGFLAAVCASTGCSGTQVNTFSGCLELESFPGDCYCYFMGSSGRRVWTVSDKTSETTVCQNPFFE